jgi:hypothetical protein
VELPGEFGGNMSITKPTGDMYDHLPNLKMWKAITGKCDFGCKYCSTKAIVVGRFKNKLGSPKLNRPFPDLKSGYTWFICSSIDMFHPDISPFWVTKILNHIKKYPDNQYLLQTKNPTLYYGYLDDLNKQNTILATTIESNITYIELYSYQVFDDWQFRKTCTMESLKRAKGFKTMITVEPIIKFDFSIFLHYLTYANPDIITIGADSKNSGLPEPTWQEVAELIEALESAGLKVVQKKNLERIRRKG